MDQDLEAKLAELHRIEKLKGPRNPSREHQYFQPTQQPQTTAELNRLEALKRPTVLPPKVEPDWIAEQRERLQREARHERLKNAIGGRLR
jgi:hypothetical protein